MEAILDQEGVFQKQTWTHDAPTHALPALCVLRVMALKIHGLPVILHKACRRYRQLATAPHAYHSQQDLHPDWDVSSRSPYAAAAALRVRGSSSDTGNSLGSSANGAISGGTGANGDCTGEFDPAIEAAKVAKGTTKLLVKALNTLQVTPATDDPMGDEGALSGAGGAGEEAQSRVGNNVGSGSGDRVKVPSTRWRPRQLEARNRAQAAIELVSSKVFGKAVREAIVRSPSEELRREAMTVLASLAEIDDDVAMEDVHQELDDEQEAAALGVEARGKDRVCPPLWGEQTVSAGSDDHTNGGMVITVTTVLVREKAWSIPALSIRRFVDVPPNHTVLAL